MSTPNELPSPEHLHAAFRVSVLSVAWTVVASTSAIAAGIVAHALVLIVFGLTGVLDAAGSWTLALHFRHALAHAEVSEKREKLALRVVSVGLLSIGLLTIEESTRRLITGGHPHTSGFGIGISAASVIVLSGLSARKRVISPLVKSPALRADGWLSATGAALGIIAVVGAAVGSRSTWVDPVAALFVALIAAGTGFSFLRREAGQLDDLCSHNPHPGRRIELPLGEGRMTESSQHWKLAFETGTLDAMGAYDRIVARVFEPWAIDLVVRLAPAEGSSVLDVACGPGTVTFLLADRVGPSGRVLATDISPSMLQIGRAKPATGAPIEWIESPAAPLAVESDSVDAVACQQGLQFFPDKTAGLAEMRRALRPGGRALVAVWTAVEDQDFFGALHASIAAAWSKDVAERYKGPFSLTGEKAAEHAREAGFADVTLERVTLPVTLEGGAPTLVESLLAAGIAKEFAALDDEGYVRLLDEVTRRTQHLERDGALYGTLTSSVLTLS